MVHISRNIKMYPRLGISVLVLSLIIVSVPDASASINFNFTNVTPRNYTIPDAALNFSNLVILTGGNIEMPSITLEFGINKTLVSGTRKLVLNATHFGPSTTSLPKQKVYTVSGTTAAVTYTIDASTSFKNTAVNVSTFRQISGNVPFFSDFSIALLKYTDLNNTWSNDSKVLDEFVNTANDENKVNETNVTLDAGGNFGPITQSLPAGNYLILVTNGTDPKKIITWNIVKVMPFNSTIKVGDGSGAAGQGLDLIVNISLSGAPLENYTYITSIINETDYLNNIGNINISWNSSGTLANSTRVNGIRLDLANSLTDIIPRSSTSRNSSVTLSTNLTLKTGSLPNGSYLVHTVVFNSTNLSVAFDQTLLALDPQNTTSVNMSGITINGTQTIPTPDPNITVTLPNGTTATLADGVTPISSITAISLPSVNSTLVNATSGQNLRFLGKNVTLLPAGAIFTPYILLTFNYSQSDVPPGVGEGNIDVYTYNGSTNSWQPLVIDSKGTYPGPGAKKFIKVRVTHFSTFALLGIGPGPVGRGPSPGGPSTGGGGVVTAEPYNNIAKAERHDKDLISNVPITYTFTAPELGVYEVAVTDTDNENAIALRVELLKGTSKLVTAAPQGTVYKNINMWAGTKRLKDISIRFKVDNKWISDNGLAPGDVKMVKWDGSTWIQLDTAQTTSDGTSTYYEAKSSTFSIFAISSVKGIAVPTATPGITAGITPAVTPLVTATPAPPATTLNWILYVFIVIVIAVVVAVYFLVVKKKGK